MPLQQDRAQINLISMNPTPSFQRSSQAPHLRFCNPTATPTRFQPATTKHFHDRIYPERLYSRKVHPKTANSLSLTDPNKRLSLTASGKHTYRPSIQGGISVLKKLYKVPSPIPLSEIPNFRVTDEQPLSDPLAALMAAVNYASSFERSCLAVPAVPEPYKITTTSCNKRKIYASSTEPPSSKRQKGKTVTSATAHRIPRLHGSPDGIQTRSMTKRRVEACVSL
ncbi:hypothetical protein DFH28DRAFT_1094859 [Melampsora americana]|nr:hypothetical protein DFH28DRAFT_1094859 [Melampsora americana]